MTNKKDNVIMIVQARMGSTRLPGKSMMDLAGAPLITRLLERAKKCNEINTIILATTCKPEDDLIEQVGIKSDIKVFRGSENDLLDRYYKAAIAFNADIIIRLPGDQPAPDSQEIDDLVLFHKNGNYDFSSNIPDVVKNGYPDGIGAEAYNIKPLKYAWMTSIDPRKREHPHFNFYENSARFHLGIMQCRDEIRRPDLKIDVNTQEEYDFVHELYRYLYPRNPEFTIIDIIYWYDNIYLKERII